MKKQLKPWLYLAVVLCMSVSCKTQDPCPDGSCCGASTQKLSYFTTVENARADTWGGGLVVENIKDAPSFCLKQRDLYESELETTYIDGKPQPFKYRVWGKIYNCDNCPVLTVNGVLQYIHIEKIEKINQTTKHHEEVSNILTNLFSPWGNGTIRTKIPAQVPARGQQGVQRPSNSIHSHSSERGRGIATILSNFFAQK